VREWSKRPLATLGAAFLATTLAMATASVSHAASLTKLDRASEVRLSIDGTSLRATIVDLHNVSQSPTVQQRLFGRRIFLGCGSSFRHFQGTTVRRVVRWPSGATSLSVRVGRDISRQAKWCLLEESGPRGGSDIAFVSFRRAEPGRRLTSGRLEDGTPWRLAAWRGNLLQPCLSFRLPHDAFGICFDDDAEEEAAVSGTVITPTCSGETFVLGSTARSAATVTVRLADKSTVGARLHLRPRASRVKAQYFVATLPSPVEVAAIEARDAGGTVLDRERHPNGMGTGGCPS
jgi:hypothetical protein